MALFLDYEFKKYIAETYVKMIRFTFYTIDSGEKDANGNPIMEYRKNKVTNLNV